MKAAFLSLFIIFLLASCTHKPDLNGLDVALFKNDRGACKGDRLQQMAWLKANKVTWKGVSSNDVEAILGKPDIQQLADRNQEYYIYFLERGEHCAKITNPSQAKTMAFRFSAIGLATEITFQNGLPD
jgi:hypothetical protein